MVPPGDQNGETVYKPRLSGLLLTLMKVIRPPSLKFKTKPPITPFENSETTSHSFSLAGDASISDFLLVEGSLLISHGSENWLPLGERVPPKKMAVGKLALSSCSGWILWRWAMVENSGL